MFLTWMHSSLIFLVTVFFFSNVWICKAIHFPPEIGLITSFICWLFRFTNFFFIFPLFTYLINLESWQPLPILFAVTREIKIFILSLKICIYLFIYLAASGLIAAHMLRCSMACGILVPWPGIEPASPALQGRFLTTEPPGKCHNNYSWLTKCYCVSLLTPSSQTVQRS